MPLPTISTPTYELKLPSNGKKIKFRPFLVREEKILILALESQESSNITNAVKDVLQKCILTRGVKVESLPTFDIEYLFLNIRGKSIGESFNVVVTCPDDNETTVSQTIFVDEIEMVRPEGNNSDIKLYNDSVKFQEIVSDRWDVIFSVSVHPFRLRTGNIRNLNFIPNRE